MARGGHRGNNQRGRGNNNTNKGRGRGRGGGTSTGGRGAGAPNFFSGPGHVLGTSSSIELGQALANHGNLNNNNNSGTVTSSYSSHQFARGRGSTGARGRGRGGRGGRLNQSTDYTETSFDYNDLNEMDLGFDSVTQLQDSTKHLFKNDKPRLNKHTDQATTSTLSVSTTPEFGVSDSNNSQPTSGTTTPHTGLGAAAAAATRPVGAKLVHAGLGANKLAAAASKPIVNNAQVYAPGSQYKFNNVIGTGKGRQPFRPLLVPVTFVKASKLTPSLDVDDHKPKPVTPRDGDDSQMSATDDKRGELDDMVLEGDIVNEVRDLALDDTNTVDVVTTALQEEQSSLNGQQSALNLPEPTSINDPVEEQPLFVVDSVGEQSSFVIDTTGEALPENDHASIPTGSSRFALGSRTTHKNESTMLQPSDDSDDDDDDEQIVFQPRGQARAAVVIDETRISTTQTVIPTESSIEPDVVSLQRNGNTARVKPVPMPKLTKAQKTALKKQGKKARKKGQAHARSGNRHLLAESESDDDDDDDDDDADNQTQELVDDVADFEDGQALFDRMKSAGVMNVDSDYDDEEEIANQDESQTCLPRQGDSDLEWGSDGPPAVSTNNKNNAKLTGRDKKRMRREQRLEQREQDRMTRLSLDARLEVEHELNLEQQEERIRPRQQRKSDIKRQQAMDDYVKNLLDVTNGDLDAMGIDMDAARTFAAGMMGAEASQHTTLQDLADAALSDGDVEAWQTESDEEDDDDNEQGSSESESDSDSPTESSDEEFDSDDELERDHALGEADAMVELALAEDDSDENAVSERDYLDSSMSSGEEDAIIQAALMSGGTIRLSSMGKSGPGGRRDRKERKRNKKGKSKAVQFVDESDDEDDDDVDEEAMMFSGRSAWDDNMMSVIHDVVEGRDRKTRNKLFKAISDGDFDAFADDYDDFSFAPSNKVKGKGKHKVKPQWEGDFADELEAQWSKDRQKKSAYKRERAEARLAAADEGSNRGKKGKKGKRSGHQTPDDFGGSRSVDSDAHIINIRIREFLTSDLTSPSISLPPMSKKSRVAVHLLAEVYGLKSKSVGSGKHRFPVLERTSRSTVFGVDERKVRAIIGTARGEREAGSWQAGRATGKMGGLWAALSGDGKKGKRGGGGGGSGGAKHSEGAVVGQGADRLGEDNIGFALLKRMGWTEGQKIGMGQGGLAEPIPARIKTSKSGLGSGFAVSMREAISMARSDDQF
ncbi:squalene synthetase-like protein [Microbotryomycetes sp. JL221]|nr:squalene synthetase-like protein [Microbotryomycetes sp. JL221]